MEPTVTTGQITFSSVDPEHSDPLIVAVAVMVALPVAVGVPLMAPVAEFKTNPEGRPTAVQV